MPEYTQENRRIAVETELGDDVLLLTEFSGQESISSLFNFRLSMLSERDDIAPDELVGSNVTVTVRREEEQERYFNGVVRSMTASGLPVGGNFREYHAEIVPALWFLTRTANCRIFQQKTPKQIIETVLKDFGVENINIRIRRTIPPLDFCVQYRETAFNFISRLMERHGIFYFFEHKDGKHILHIADHNAASLEPEDSNVPYEPGGVSGPHINHWAHSYEFRSAKYTQSDVNFTDPYKGGVQETSEKSVLKYAAKNVTDLEIFDYPGGYDITGEGKELVRTRIKQEEAPHDAVEGAGNCLSFHAGAKFKLKSHVFEEEAEGAYILTAVSHFATENSYVTGHLSSQTSYSNSFTCIPDKYEYQPQRKTIKPRISGSQTAIVTGKSGEDSWADKYGRVKVQFFWDREGQHDENSSCWIRVGQIWAGPNWGAYFVPRIGHEVIVEFLEGDPDRPIITGSVYNSDNVPPYGTEGGTGGGPVTTSTIKSLSTKGGDAGDTYNEIRFEDKLDEEELFIQAEKNLKITIKNNRETTVGVEKADPGDDELTVQNDQVVEIGNDQKIDVGNEITIEAGSKITLKTGQASITMSSDGTIDIEGMTVTVKGTSVTVKGDADATVQSPNTTIKGDGMVTVQGGMVKIN